MVVEVRILINQGHFAENQICLVYILLNCYFRGKMGNKRKSIVEKVLSKKYDLRYSSAMGLY